MTRMGAGRGLSLYIYIYIYKFDLQLFIAYVYISLSLSPLQQITIGIHSGEVVTGVIGNRVPRYCLFGNTVNLTSRTETTGVPGRINISEETYR